MPACNVCAADLHAPVYTSTEARSVTSMCEFYDGATVVSFCDACGHLQTAEIRNIEEYYDTSYNIHVDDDEEDALYRIVDGKKVFRVAHQVETLLRKIDVPNGARVLDYGCAKSATTRSLREVRPDVDVHLFDVSSAYKPFWEKFVAIDKCAVYEPKPEWASSFDVVLSFFALEHVATPARFAREVARLIKPGGFLHLLVPNVYANTADFVVADHVNHFSAASLRRLFHDAGFDPVDIDDGAHDAAFVVTARKSASARPMVADDAEIAALRKRVAEMSAFWGALAGRVRAFESRMGPGKRAAVYGSGFYGTFIASCIQDLSRIECFFDRNPFRHTKTLLGKKIVPPESAEPGIELIYVGLNPRVAREAIESLEVFRERPREFFYL